MTSSPDSDVRPVSRECHGDQPKLCREIVSINMHVRRLIWFVAIEVESVRARSQSSRRDLILQNCTLFRTGIH